MLGFLFYFSLLFVPIFAIAIYESYYDGNWYELFEVLMPITMSSIAFALLLILLVSGLDPEDRMERFDTKTPIYSMYNSGEIQGSFFLLTGTIDEKQYYTYLKMNKHGNYVKDRIKESYDGTVEIKTYTDTTKYHPQIIRYWEGHYNEGFFTIDYSNEELLRTVIQIPEGSLKRQIKIK